MNPKKSCACTCCSNRVTANERRPVTGKCVRLFVATRLFPTYLPTDCYICNKYRLMYNKWKLLAEWRGLRPMGRKKYVRTKQVG
jgi:hypothetical protein